MDNVKQPSVEYDDREQLDAELYSALSDILSAEEESRRIISQAEASVKAIQLDTAATERTMREANGKTCAKAKSDALELAGNRADAERQKLIQDAQKAGDELVASKQKQIKARIAELYAMIGGKA